ncbi:MAG: hypothetical protein JWN67_435 [Actinomycetia bacterium]|nr:hypothetical protein [Actinomycetes bacterium]
MHADSSSAWERTRKAAEALALGRGGLRDRLRIAFLDIAPLKGEEFGPGLSDEYTSVMERLGTQAQIPEMDEDDARKVAEDLWRLFLKVETQHVRRRPPEDDL